MSIDFKAERPVITDEAITKVANLAEVQMKLERELTELQEDMDRKKEELRKVQEYDLPEAMSECGITEFKHKDGFKVSVKPFYSGKISPENIEAAHDWLRKNNFEGIIKHNLKIELGKGQDDIAGEVKEFIKALGLSFEDKEGVHHSTLNAFIKEQTEMGTEIPSSLFGVFIGRKAKVSLK